VGASGVTYIPPVVALVIGTVLAGEPVRGLDVIAMAAILLGVGTLQSVRRCVEQD
jgi:drug/metabolite transporter (DMT)-like permease